MTVPFTGAVILVVGFGLFFLSPKLLYAAMIVFIPFSATAVVNLQSGGEGKGVAAWLFFGALWLLREALSGLPPWRKKGWFASRRSRWALFAFLGAVFASLFVPLVLNGTSWVPDPNPIGTHVIPLQLGAYNLTQTAYLAFGVLLAVFTAAENTHPLRLLRTLKLYVGSCIFVSAWGLFEFWCNLTGQAYPAYIFNTSTTVSALGFKQSIALGLGNLKRVSSVALEPSVLAQELLIAFVVLLVYKGLHRPLLSKRWDYAGLVLISATLVASTSTTAYAGILIALVFVTVALSRTGRTPKRYLLLAAGAVGAAILLIAVVPLVRDLVKFVILNKTQTFSGLHRSRSLAFAAHDFMRYPILGAGWHAVDCWDLVLLLMANTGIVGLLAFGSFILPVLVRLWKAAAKRKEACVVLFATVALTLSLCEAAGLIYSAGYVWLVLGLGAGAAFEIQPRPARLAGLPAGRVRCAPEHGGGLGGVENPA
jgi:hypothetical protein